jgi:hypothetical protein
MVDINENFVDQVTNSLSGTNEAKYYVIEADEGEELTVSLDGPDGQDFDLYVRYGSKPTTREWDKRGYTPTSKESITIDPAKAGYYYIMVHSYRGSGQYTLKTTIPFEEKDILAVDQVTDNLFGTNKAKYYIIKAEEGKKIILNLVGPLDADFDLYVRCESKPTKDVWDYRGYSGTSKETIIIDSTKAGKYYVMVHSYRGSGDFTLKASEIGDKELIITSKNKIIEKYGEDVFQQVGLKIQEYMRALKNNGIDSVLIYVDDVDCLRPFSQEPVDPNNPTEIKGLIDALDKKFGANYFLIIGGHSIIPFHSISNPCGNDGDKIVYSDSPYASRDEEYLIPERALGRIPDSKASNPDFLIFLLENAAMRHRHSNAESFGYSAKVWVKASKAVYECIGNVVDLKNSPPKNIQNFNIVWIDKKGYHYFNLHGSEESKNWYGQEGSRYPVAFSPDILNNADVENAVICTEACYGANIVEKEVDEAISLMFLQKGAACFVGSTKIAYGPRSPPSTDADLVCLKFFERIKSKLSFGEAFMQAKHDFSRESIAQKGYLDDTDKKALLEYVLFGDPSLKMEVMI